MEERGLAVPSSWCIRVVAVVETARVSSAERKVATDEVDGFISAHIESEVVGVGGGEGLTWRGGSQ